MDNYRFYNTLYSSILHLPKSRRFLSGGTAIKRNIKKVQELTVQNWNQTPISEKNHQQDSLCENSLYQLPMQNFAKIEKWMKKINGKISQRPDKTTHL